MQRPRTCPPSQCRNSCDGWIFRVRVTAGRQYRHEHLRLPDLTCFRVGDRHGHSGIIHLHFLAAFVRQTHTCSCGLIPALIMLTELCLPISVRILLAVFLPQQSQAHPALRQLAVHLFPVGQRGTRDRLGRGAFSLETDSGTAPLRSMPSGNGQLKPTCSGALQIFPHRAVGNLTDPGDGPLRKPFILSVVDISRILRTGNRSWVMPASSCLSRQDTLLHEFSSAFLPHIVCDMPRFHCAACSDHGVRHKPVLLCGLLRFMHATREFGLLVGPWTGKALPNGFSTVSLGASFENMVKTPPPNSCPSKNPR